MKKTVVIAAAGSGSRLAAGLPKCLISLHGRTILEYQFKAFEDFDTIRMVVGYRADHVMEEAVALRRDVVFVKNDDYKNTTTLQSMHLGARGINGKALFVDGDMVFTRATAAATLAECELGDNFIGVASEISNTPVYAGIDGGMVTWFSFERQGDREWGNMAYIDCSKLEYNKTHFFVQLEKFLPIKAFEIDRLEVDTPDDLAIAKKIIGDNPEKFDFWGSR